MKIRLIVPTLLLSACSLVVAADPFVVKPYLQLGPNPAPGSLRVVWHAPDDASDWSLEYAPTGASEWKTSPAISNRVVVKGIAPHLVVRADVVGVGAGKRFAYRVKRAGATVFEAEGLAPKGPGQAQRFVSFGDCGANTPAQKGIAVATLREKPDYVMITGDIVYSRGRISEYAEKFWPIYNAEKSAAGLGAPLLRSTLFVGAPGNHDIATRDFDKFPDGMAYFLYWDQPLNGPTGPEGGPIVGKLTGAEAAVSAFRSAAGKSFPAMANFSFDYGDIHWTVIDANSYVDWKSSEARGWLEKDLEAARDARWRFVSFHHPGFNSSKAHFDDQRTRVLAPVFEKGKVDVVFTGHVHNYQRTYPLRFVPDPRPVMVKNKLGVMVKSDRVDGKWTLDRDYDGAKDTTPDGVLYLVTGAGGQTLYNPEQQDDPKSWQEFTVKFTSKVNTFTVVDVDGGRVLVRQLGADGKEYDRFTITK